MRLYLAGPMTGCPDWNFPAFRAAAAFLRAQGHDVFDPSETENGDTSKPRSYYMRIDIEELLACNAVAVLPGWQASRGASLEVEIARQLDLPVLDAATLEPVHAQCRVQVWDSERREWIDYELMGPWELSEVGVDLIVDTVLG